MLRRTLLAALALVLWSATAVAQTPARGKLFTRVADGLVRAVIRIELDERWHLYHEELGHPKAVGLPTTVTFYGEGIEWSRVRFPVPVRLDQSDLSEGAFILAHEHELVLYAAGRLAPGASLEGLEVKVKGLVCEDIQGCIQYRQTLTTSGAGEDALFAAFPADLFAPAAAAVAAAEAPSEGSEERGPVPGLVAPLQAANQKLDVQKGEHADATLYTRVEGGEVRAALEIDLDEGWHLYHTADDLGLRPIGIPTTITLGGEGITWEAPRFPAPKRLDQSAINGEGAYINAHEGTIVVYARGTLAPGASGAGRVAELSGQVCDPSYCLNYSETAHDRGNGSDAVWSGWDAAWSARPEPAPAPLDEPAQEGLLGFLLLAVAGGLITLVMPCTYPMIPITVSFFTKQADKRGGNALGLSLAYGAGIVLIFVLVGVVFGGLIKPFAAHPVTNLVFALAFLYFALVLFGVVNLEPPRFLMNFAGSASSHGGYLGVFLMGATLVITSFTCTAPFVGSLLSIGAGGPGTGRVALGMAVFGLTMAVPFMLLSLVPARVKAMPRSGEWMNTFKVTLGFVEIAAALKFLSNSDLVWQWSWLSRELFLFLWVAIFGVAALFLFGLIPLKGPQTGVSPARMSAGLAFALFTLYCWSGATGSSMDAAMTAIIPPYSNRPEAVGGAVENKRHVVVADDYEAARARAIAEKKLLLVNFTGWTCVNCRLNEEKIFPAESVRELLSEHFVEARLHTDGDRGEELSAFQEQLTSSIATPLYQVLDPATERKLGGQVGGTQSVAGFRGFLRAALDAGQPKVGALTR
jgi:thiol:disulfide interchange protein DsbD